MSLKRYREGVNVLQAARERISYTFDHFPKVYVSFSGGKDSTVMLHLVMEEAIRRGRTVGVLIVDLEAQYTATVEHLQETVDLYREHIDLHWVCLPMALRNAVTNYEPKWMCWDEDKREIWVREKPEDAASAVYDWYVPGMEFEEFVVAWGDWYANGDPCACFVGIRADESINRFRTVALWDKRMHNDRRWTTGIVGELYNVYPIYDWRTEDIWRFHGARPDLPYNRIYDLMHRAGVPLSQQRLCQPYGDDQRRGLWLYHVLEPHTWFRLIARTNGANAGALYVQENGNVNGYGRVTKPDDHTWESFTNLLLASMPKVTRDHYTERFKTFIKGWKGRGYAALPDEAPKVLEDAHWAPSWRRLAKVLLRNDWWCKGLGMQQPRSVAYHSYREIVAARKKREAAEAEAEAAIASTRESLEMDSPA